MSFIATDQPEKARAFYSDVLGLKLLEASPFVLVFADGEHVLRVQIVSDLQPATYTVHGWEVASLQSEMEGLTAKGVDFLHFGQLPQNALGVWQTPDGHMISWFHDPSGNILSLTQYARK